MNDFSKKQINDMIDSVSGNFREEGDKLKDAVNSGSLDAVLKKLKPSDAEKLQKVLSNKEEAEKLLQTPQAQMLMKKFLNNK